jgi:hypothetical protein
MVSALIRSPQLSEKQRDDLYAFLSQGGVAFAGRALYPRYFEPGAGNPGVSKANLLSPKPYPRLGFYLVGMENNNLALPVDGEPSSFPNASDVLVVGCSPRDILLVARFSAAGAVDEIYLRSLLPARLRCPLPPMPEADDG